MTKNEAQGEIILVTGGTRSGKSQFAEALVAGLGKPVVYIATALVKDPEMEMRVKIHRARRPASWLNVEEPFNVADAVRREGKPGNVILLDCLTFLLVNLMFRQELPEHEEEFKAEEERMLRQISEIVAAARETGTTLVVVSNESGLGLIPADRLSRKYQEIVGRANQIMAGAADRVYLVIAGIPVEIKEMGNKILNEIGRVD